MSIVIAGKTYDVPGVYGNVEVKNTGSLTLPAFNNIILVGASKKGIPFNASGKTGADVIKGFSAVNDMKEFFGVSDLTKAAEYAKKGGAGVIYAVNVASLTRAAATIQNNEGTPEDMFDVVPRDKFWGAAGNDISITMATDTVLTVTIIPPKLTKFLTANASTSSNIIAVENVEGLYIGQTIKLVDNSETLQSTTITAISGNNITLAANASAAFATASYARIFVEDLDKSEIKTFTATTIIEDVIDWINSGKILTADRSTYTATTLPTTLAKTYLMNITGATAGTSPDATTTSGGSYDAFADGAAQQFEEFTNATGVRLRLLNLLTNIATVHAVYRALALDLRENRQYSIQVISGAATGNVALAVTDSSSPVQRAKSLNSGDFILAGMNIDGVQPHLSLAPFVGGLMSANSVKRNLTNDVVPAVSVEKTFGEYNKETETKVFLNAGVIIVGTGKNGYYIVQGVNTYQNHASSWNEEDDTSYLIQQRQIVDYVYEGYKEGMEAGVGADNYGPDIARVQGNNILQEYFDGGFIVDYAMLDAYKSGNAVVTKPQITPLEGTDFVGFELEVLIPE